MYKTIYGYRFRHKHNIQDTIILLCTTVRRYTLGIGIRFAVFSRRIVRRLFISRGSIVEAATMTIIIISINTSGRKDCTDTRRERPSSIYTTKPDDDAAAVLLTQTSVCVRAYYYCIYCVYCV